MNLAEPSLLKAVARVAAAKVAEAVKEVDPHHLVLERVALIGRIATNLH